MDDGMMGRNNNNEMVFEEFAVSNGMKQGYVVAPIFYSLMFSALLMDAYHDERPGIRFAYRTDRHLRKSQRMQAPTRVSMTTVHKLFFADDSALNAMKKEYMQSSMDFFAAGWSCTNRNPAQNTMLPEPMSTSLNSKMWKTVLSGKHTVTKHENPRRGCSTDLQSQPGLRPATGRHVESSRYSLEQQTEDVQGHRLECPILWSGDLDRLLEPSQEAESFPSQLPPQNSEAEME
ncbi:unnamed protein product [Schistocephalus solidus]|uniref:Reverse transcriptase domain-containing protein n=1 Tax=Schistocephalus solidus TaxID=70667 RepID=A0A183TLD2_SCHSO|nr:unnamed protein product [Schistocephalus solidus]